MAARKLRFSCVGAFAPQDERRFLGHGLYALGYSQDAIDLSWPLPP